ncbi:MAG: DUF3256 family protein [Bacteroidaceae bacterium]|nr:DUF3256 family protein [Bacteroidaceae bacterium]
MKKILVTAILSLFAFSGFAQTMRQLFVSLPDSVLMPQLTKVNREDCIDFLDSKMKAEVTNRFDGKSTLDTLSANYLHLTLSPMSGVEMKLLTVNDSVKVVCWIQTYGNDSTIKESTVRFFTSSWEPIPAERFLTVPSASEFVHDAENAETDVALALTPLYVAASFVPGENAIRFSLSLGHIAPDLLDKVRKYVSPDKVCRLKMCVEYLNTKDDNTRN